MLFYVDAIFSLDPATRFWYQFDLNSKLAEQQITLFNMLSSQQSFIRLDNSEVRKFKVHRSPVLMSPIPEQITITQTDVVLKQWVGDLDRNDTLYFNMEQPMEGITLSTQGMLSANENTDISGTAGITIIVDRELSLKQILAYAYNKQAEPIMPENNQSAGVIRYLI